MTMQAVRAQNTGKQAINSVNKLMLEKLVFTETKTCINNYISNKDIERKEPCFIKLLFSFCKEQILQLMIVT